jgi:Ankyrin repeat
LDSAVAFFYCDGNQEHKRLPRYILGSIVRQLFLLTSLHHGSPQENYLRNFRKNNLNTSNLVPALIACTKWIAAFFTDVTIMLDGLDECSRPWEDFLDHTSQLASGNIKMLVTSRPEGPMFEAFCVKPQMAFDDALIQTDIATYIDFRLANNRGLRNIKVSLKTDIRTKLLEKCAASYIPLFRKVLILLSFRWVQCQLDYLGTLKQDSKRRQAIENLPPGLYETYKRMLDRLNEVPGQLQIATTALMWLIYSAGPLTLAELAVAAIYDPKVEFDEEEKFDSDDMVLDYCCSFARLNKKYHPTVVEISHISVTQYLKSETLLDGTPNPYFLGENDAHMLLLKVCLNQIMSDIAKWPGSAGDDGFESAMKYYAQSHMWLHARKVQKCYGGQDLMGEFFLNLAKTESTIAFINWIAPGEGSPSWLCYSAEKLNVSGSTFACPPETMSKLRRMFGPINLAVQLGLVDVAAALLDRRGYRFDEDATSAFALAVCVPQRETVNLFISKDLDRALETEWITLLLNYIAKNRWWDVLERFHGLLRERGVQSPSAVMNSIVLSSADDLESVSRLLPQQKSELNRLIEPSTSDVFVTPIFSMPFYLFGSCRRIPGHDDYTGPPPLTPLHAAIIARYGAIARFLIHQGADVNFRDRKGQTCLHWCLLSSTHWLSPSPLRDHDRNIGIIALLMKEGGDPTIEDNQGLSPLHLAMQRGALETAEILYNTWKGKDVSKLSLSARGILQQGSLDFQLQKWSTRLPDDIKLLDMIAVNYIRRFAGTYGGIDKTQAVLDSFVERDPRNDGVRDVEGLWHRFFCQSCDEPIRAIRWIFTNLLFRHQRWYNICSECRYRKEGLGGNLVHVILATQIPSEEWVRYRFPSCPVPILSLRKSFAMCDEID